MLRRPTRVLLSVLGLTVILDQLTKSAIRVLWGSTAAELPLDGLAATLLSPRFDPASSLPVIGEYLQITHVRNTGAAFGMLPGYRPVFMAATGLVLVAIAAYWRRHAPRAWPIVVGLGLICGGAVGNLIDRALTGRVTDFIYVAVIDFPVFNVADSALVVGVGILMAWLLFEPEMHEIKPQVEVESTNTPHDISVDTVSAHAAIVPKDAAIAPEDVDTVSAHAAIAPEDVDSRTTDGSAS